MEFGHNLENPASGRCVEAKDFRPAAISPKWSGDPQMYAVFKAGNSHRVVDAELRDILPFGRFRRLVFDRLDVRTVYRDGRWFRDVIAAAKRGGIDRWSESQCRRMRMTTFAPTVFQLSR